MRQGGKTQLDARNGNKEFFSLFRDRYFLLLMLISTIVLFLACQMWLSRPLFVNIGCEGDERYVKGFYHREGDEGFSYRWTKDSSTVRFPDMGYMPARIGLAMDGARPEGQPLPQVSVLASGEPIADFVAQNGIRAYEFDYFPSSFPLPRDLLLEIKTETFVPVADGDSRALGVLVNTVEVRPIYGSLSFPLLMVSLEIALAGTFSVSLGYLVLQRMRISRWVSLGLCSLLVVSLVLNVAGRFVTSGLVLMLLPLFLLSSYGVVILVESLGYSLENWGEVLRQGAILKRLSIAASGAVQVRRGWREHAAAAGLIAVFTLIFFAPLLSGNTFSMVGAHMYAQEPWIGLISNNPEIGGRGYPQTDHAETFYPLSVFAANALRSGQFPMWLPFSFGGIPLLEFASAGILYPPRLLVTFFLSPIRQHDLLLVSHLLLAGLGMYALLRCWGANAFGATLGAIVWELNGHNAFWLVFEHLPITAAWLPVMLLGATLTVRRRSVWWAIATGAALGIVILQGSLHYVYLGALLLAGWYGALAVLAARALFLQGRQRSALFCLALPVLSAIVVAALSAAYWLPFLQMLSAVHRQPLSLEAQLNNAFPWAEVIRGLLFPEDNPAGKDPDFPSLAFVGLPALILAVPALFRRSAPVLLGSILGAVSLGMIVGVRPLYLLLLKVLPYWGTFHPHEGFYLFCFAIAVLAGLGASEVHQRLAKAGMSGSFWFVLGSAVLVAEAWQLISFARAINPVQPARTEWLYPETPLITTLQELQRDHRVLPIYWRLDSGDWTPPVFAGKVAAAFGIRSGSGYESLLPLHTALLWKTVEQGGVPITPDHLPPSVRPFFFHDRLPLSLLEKLSVGLLVTLPDVQPLDVSGRDPLLDGTLRLVYQGADGWIYEDTHALPRAFLVPRVVAVPDPLAALQMLADPSFDAREAAIVIGGLPSAQAALLPSNVPANGPEAAATIVRDRLNDVEIQATTSNTALLVLNDSWAPGWKAFVDGMEQPVLRVNYAFRGVIVPEGEHHILFLYRPRLLLIGLTVSAGSLLLVTFLYAGVGLHALYQSIYNRNPGGER